MPPSHQHASVFSQEHSAGKSSSEQPQGSRDTGLTPFPTTAGRGSCAILLSRGDKSTEVKICQQYNTSDPTCSHGLTFPLLFNEANTAAVGVTII